MTFKKLAVICLVFCVTLFVFACNNSQESTDSGSNSTELSQDSGAITSDTVIVYESSLFRSASNIRSAIYELHGKTPKITSDPNTSEGKNEILIGNTGRAESSQFISELDEFCYGVRVIQSEASTKVVIAANESAYVPDAVKVFLEDYMPKDKSNPVLLKTEDTIKENTDAKTLSEIEKAQPIGWIDQNVSIASGGYARACNLPDGRIACVYSSGSSIKMKTSTNEGKTWSGETTVITLTKTPAGDKMTIANANIVVMNNKDLMVAFRAHTSGSSYSSFYSSIRYCISSDNGKTWSADKIVVENTHEGTQFTGFWEPHMIYVKDGRLAMYYASDCIGGNAQGFPFVKSMTYQHIIVHLYDEEKKAFGEPIIASDGEKHNSRDGMPVVCKLSDGNYAMVIESSSMRSRFSFVIQILFSEDGIVWSDPKTIFMPTVDGNYAGAPFIECLPDGRIAVSCQATQDSGCTVSDSSVNNSVMNVIISSAPVTYKDKDTINTSSFTKLFFNPITTKIKDSYSIWPAMLVCKDKLLCIAECGYNTGATARKGTGIFVTVGIIR